MMSESPYVLMFDGGSRGNPGICGSGFVIYHNTDMIYNGSLFVSEKNTNNYAEYMSIIIGLECAIKNNISDIHIKGDSLLVINQLTEKWKVSSENIKPLYIKAKSLLTKFKTVCLSHVKRKENTVADSLANKAMDEYVLSNS